jgi:hypothetical protein
MVSIFINSITRWKPKNKKAKTSKLARAESRALVSFGVFMYLFFIFSFLFFILDPANADSPESTPQTNVAQTQESMDQQQILAELRKKIADQKTKPAPEVFQNIQLLKTVPAGAILSIMETGYSKSLGVNCSYCHVIGHWELDDKPTKQTARNMVLMTRTINQELLKKIPNLKSENPAVNCTTCHRGQTQPALDIN